MTIRLAVGQSPVLTDEYLAFAAQVGATGVQLNTPDLPGEGRWEVDGIRALVDRVEAAGLRLEAIENVPNAFYDRLMVGGDGREEQLDNMRATVRALGAAGVPVLGLNWMPQSVWRTALGPYARGGAHASVYDERIATDPARAGEVWVARRDQHVADAKDSWIRGSYIPLPGGVTEVDDAAMWANLEYFLRGILPTAEEAGVVIAFHPDDPPTPSTHGVARILRSVDALDRYVHLVDSPNLKLELCLGSVSQMGGEEAVLDAVRRFGPEGKIAYVHLRDVRGVAPVFTEAFLGDGNYDPYTVIRALHETGFDGFLIDDHTPGLVGDDAYGYRGRAHAIGYLQALLHVVQGRDRSE